MASPPLISTPGHHQPVHQGPPGVGINTRPTLRYRAPNQKFENETSWIIQSFRPLPTDPPAPTPTMTPTISLLPLLLMTAVAIPPPVPAPLHQIRVFETPGDYTLTPADYAKAPQIIFEIWGPGGCGGCGNMDDNTVGQGGGSGAYLLAYVPTNSDKFLIHIGAGTICNLTTPDNTSITTPANTNTINSINLIVGGGFPGADRVAGKGGTILSTTGATQSQAYPGSPGEEGYYMDGSGEALDYIYHSGRGADSPKGGSGGRPETFTTSGRNFPTNGQTPGAGGGGWFRSIGDRCDSAKPAGRGRGGHGTVVAYFTPTPGIGPDA